VWSNPNNGLTREKISWKEAHVKWMIVYYFIEKGEDKENLDQSHVKQCGLKDLQNH